LLFTKQIIRIGTRKAEVLNSLIMKLTVNENDTNNILQTVRSRNVCRLYRFHWPWFSL